MRTDSELLRLQTYSQRPYIISTTAAYTASQFESIEVLDDTVIAVLTLNDNTNCVTGYNITGVTLPAGTVLTDIKPYKAITLTSGMVKINRCNVVTE